MKTGIRYEDLKNNIEKMFQSENMVIYLNAY